MSPPRKRPRLHFVCSVSPPPGSEVDAARRTNDLLLKTRWESVFQKYERDFEGIGDEIGFINDDIVVNNGHLRSMRNEGDTGLSHKQITKSNCGGKRLLRAMTTAPSECASSESDVEQVQEVQEVIQSIESMTDHMFMDENSSDDELFRPFTRSLSEERPAIKEEDMSDTDALFDFRLPKRSQSVDSLFDSNPNHDLVAEAPVRDFLPRTYTKDSPNACPVPNTKTVLEEQRSMIREEVRNVLNEQKEEEEARIEPAWRIPIHQTSHPPLRKSSLARSQSDGTSDSQSSRGTSQRELDRTSHSNENEEDDEIKMGGGASELNQIRSLWRPARRERRTKKAVVAEKNLKTIRAESEDPLQGDFPSDREELAQKLTTTRPILQNREYQWSEENVSEVGQTSPEIKSSEMNSMNFEVVVDSDESESELSHGVMAIREVSPDPECDSRSASSTRNSTPSLLSERPEISPPTSTTSAQKNEEPEEWEVEQIADSRMQGQKRKLLQYKVIWKGYDPTWSSWREVLPGCDRLVQQFHIRFPHKPGPPLGYSFQPMSESSADADDPL